MRRGLLLLFSAASILGHMASSARAAEILLNGNLDNPGIHESDAIASWTLEEFVTAANMPGQNPATFATFADHTTLPNNDGIGTGLWLRPFAGLFLPVPDGTEPVDAILTQIVPGTAGRHYTFSGWSLWEGGYSGGVAALDAASPSGAVPSPTETFMEIRFLDAAFTGISGVLLDVRTVQMNDATWRKHSLSSIPPPGTANILVTAYMIEGVANINKAPGGQSAFFDDFSLIEEVVVPEPSTVALGLIGLVGIFAARRVDSAAEP